MKANGIEAKNTGFSLGDGTGTVTIDFLLSQSKALVLLILQQICSQEQFLFQKD